MRNEPAGRAPCRAPTRRRDDGSAGGHPDAPVGDGPARHRPAAAPGPGDGICDAPSGPRARSAPRQRGGGAGDREPAPSDVPRAAAPPPPRRPARARAAVPPARRRMPGSGSVPSPATAARRAAIRHGLECGVATAARPMTAQRRSACPRGAAPEASGRTDPMSADCPTRSFSESASSRSDPRTRQATTRLRPTAPRARAAIGRTTLRPMPADRRSIREAVGGSALRRRRREEPRDRTVDVRGWAGRRIGRPARRKRAPGRADRRKPEQRLDPISPGCGRCAREDRAGGTCARDGIGRGRRRLVGIERGSPAARLPTGARVEAVALSGRGGVQDRTTRRTASATGRREVEAATDAPGSASVLE